MEIVVSTIIGAASYGGVSLNERREEQAPPIRFCYLKISDYIYLARLIICNELCVRYTASFLLFGTPNICNINASDSHKCTFYAKLHGRGGACSSRLFVCSEMLIRTVEDACPYPIKANKNAFSSGRRWHGRRLMPSPSAEIGISQTSRYGRRWRVSDG